MESASTADSTRYLARTIQNLIIFHLCALKVSFGPSMYLLD